MQFKFLALAFATSVFAASSSDINTSASGTISVSATATASQCKQSVTATAQSDLDALSSCETFEGDIEISGSLATATINGIKTLSGSLTVNNATSLTSLNAPALETIAGTFDLEDLTRLNVLAFPELTSVGAINFITLPTLSSFQFNAGISECKSVVISDTNLSSLDGIVLSDVDTFNINNNKYLKQLQADITSISEALIVSFNAASVSVSFPNLEWANNMTFNDVASISMPALTKVNASLGFTNNSLSGVTLNNLTSIGSAFFVVGNSQLTNLSFSDLKTVGGGLQIANNTKLSNIVGFPKLESCASIDIIGNFSYADLPSLDSVSGGVTIDSSSSSFNCSNFNSLSSDGDIKGAYACKAASSSTSVASGSATSKASSTGSATGSSGSSASSTASSTSKAGAAAVAAPAVERVTVGAVLLTLLYQLI